MDKKTIFWDKTQDVLFLELESGLGGLSSDAAKTRLEEANRRHRRFILPAPLRLFLGQFKSFITLILLFSALLSIALSDATDGVIILCILFITALLGFWQEHGAEQAVKKLIALVHVTALVLRDGETVSIPLEDVVPGDVVLLSAGDLVPGDCLVLDTKDLFVDESALTGETFPSEKQKGVVDAAAPIASRTNVLYLGTHIVSGTGKALVVGVGEDTEFGEIQKRLTLNLKKSDFQQGLAKFGAFLAHITFALVVGIFFLNVYFHRPVLESLLFSLALAVGLTPQLLPAVVSVNLAWGARAMAAKKVIVRRLDSIENFGSMDVLCSDKTGTLTSGKIHLKQALNGGGSEDPYVFHLGFINAAFQTGFVNPLDIAIKDAAIASGLSLSGWEKLDEIPYDFTRKRLSILAKSPEGEVVCVTKGAFAQIIDVCTSLVNKENAVQFPLSDDEKERLKLLFNTFGDKGFRAIAVAIKRMVVGTSVLLRQEEEDMIFVGFLIFEDPIKEDTAEVIAELKKSGINLKMITGDNARVAKTIALQAGMIEPQILTGLEIQAASDGALIALAAKTDVFAEVEPNQKERLVLALRKSGHVVGYMGDGINDISALNAADIGISVDSAVDAAKQTADIILLEKSLNVLLDGVFYGRRTFANTMKYIYMATSANFGNMFSMACAALFLPFLPLLPKQILLTNILTDLPEMTMSSDNVDLESMAMPQRWDIKYIRDFMLRFGLLSSVFDIMTFAVLLYLKATPDLIRTGWFVESVVSAVLIVLLVRTRKPFYKSRPHGMLVVACACSIIFAVLLPFTALGHNLLGFVPLPTVFLVAVGVIVLLYMISVEILKHFFYKYH